MILDTQLAIRNSRSAPPACAHNRRRQRARERGDDVRRERPCLFRQAFSLLERCILLDGQRHALLQRTLRVEFAA